MTATPTAIFMALLLSGLLGMLGQGVRALGGMKKMVDQAAAQDVGSADLFMASRLLVSLMIGFLAGVAAGLALGLQKLLSVNEGSIQLLLGIAAAGYAGTDFIESFLQGAGSGIKGAAGRLPAVPKAPAPPPPAALAPTAAVSTALALQPLTGGVLNPKYGVAFGSLVEGGFFSGDPDAPGVNRSIRTNNPGALNFSGWQKTRVGYVGITQPDNSPQHNVTTIYRTPEHGVAAWYNLIARRYGFPGSTFTLRQLAKHYAGVTDDNAPEVRTYIAGWTRFAPTLAADQPISASDSAAMLLLAKGMFGHEAGTPTPLHDDQITFAIEREQANTLPA